MKEIQKIAVSKYVTNIREAPEPLSGACTVYECEIHFKGFDGSAVFGYNEGSQMNMQHVSVSRFDTRIPTWNEMCEIKDIFFKPEEMVVQIHPAKERYVHKVFDLDNVLHLWRPIDGDFSALNYPEKWD